MTESSTAPALEGVPIDAARANDPAASAVDGTDESAGAAVQPRGVLLVVRADDGVLLHVSTSIQAHLGVSAEDVVGRPLSEAIGDEAERLVLDRAATVLDLKAVNPLTVQVPQERGGGTFDLQLHRPRQSASAAPPLLVVELEPAAGPRPLTVSGTYGTVRAALADLERSASSEELYDITVRTVRDLTGFDRVAVYRFDALGNSEVVADAHRPGLKSHVGVHYPPSDFSSEMLDMYQTQRVRHVPDFTADHDCLVSADLPAARVPVDLTAATLRAAVSPQRELQVARGIRAGLVASLSHGGRMWGVLVCHHYDGPLVVPVELRAAIELVASTVSALGAAQVGLDRDAETRRQERVLAHLAASSRDESVPLGIAITRSGWTRRLVNADGAIVRAEGRVTTVGHVPDEPGQKALLDWVASADDEVVLTDSLRKAAPEVAAAAPGVAGVMGIGLPEGQVVVWLRDEVQHRIEWGGDPSTSRPEAFGDPVRTMVRPSLERWREVVDGHSLPWTEDQVESAVALRGHLVEALYLRGRKELRATEELQRSLLPHGLPELDGWTVDARYDAAGSGLVGGDWYDALILPSGHLAVVVGDVTGHGLQAAATMGQLRTALRTSLVGTCSAYEAVRQLLEVVRWTLPNEVATLSVALVDPATGVVENVSLGHPPMLVVHPGGDVEWSPRAGAPPLGVTEEVPTARRFEVPVGATLVLYSDGLVERRDESIREGLDRLARAFADGGGRALDDVVQHTRDESSTDDATLLVVRHSR